MPSVLHVVREGPPDVVFVVQTRGPLILRDIEILRLLPDVRVGFSITTDREDVRRIFEPHCAPLEERWRTVGLLREAGIKVSITIAPILPCHPEELARRVIEMTTQPLIVDPFHVRAVKKSGATTRPAAVSISDYHGWNEWLDPEFQQDILARMKRVAKSAGRPFGSGPAGFGLLACRQAGPFPLADSCNQSG